MKWNFTLVVSSLWTRNEEERRNHKRKISLHICIYILVTSVLVFWQTKYRLHIFIYGLTWTKFFEFEFLFMHNYSLICANFYLCTHIFLTATLPHSIHSKYRLYNGGFMAKRMSLCFTNNVDATIFKVFVQSLFKSM